MKFSFSKFKKSKTWKKNQNYLSIFALLALALLPVMYIAGQQTSINSLAAAGTTTISVKPSTINDHSCDTTEWHFVINQVRSKQLAPASITVTWGEDTQTILLDKFTGR